MSGWQDISTAPRMEHVLFWLPNGEHVIGFLNHKTQAFHLIGYLGKEEPTHWMPLPDPPDLQSMKPDPGDTKDG